MELKQITDKEVKILVESQNTSYDDESNYNRQYTMYLAPLVPIKEELTILGGVLLGRTDVKKFSSDDFKVINVCNLWEQLEENDFNLEDIDFNKSHYYYDFEDSEINHKDFIKIVKYLAENTSDIEFQAIFQKLDKMSDIRNCCEEIHNSLESIDKEDFFQKRYNILINSSRLETLSIHQIKKFLTPLNVVDIDYIINNATSLTKGLTSLLTSKIEDDNKGVDLAFPLITKAINGLRKGQLIATGMFSNNGKTRLMIRNIANLVLKHNKKVLIISNEMTEKDIMYCFITTVINNTEFKEMFDSTGIIKNEIELTRRNYKDTIEFEKITDITKAIEEKFNNTVFILHTDNYSDEVLTEIILTYYMCYDVDYFFYDTLKSEKNNMANWDSLKITTTILSELAKIYDICIWGNIQLNDTSKAPLEINSNDIASSKQIYQLLDTLFLFSPIDKKYYSQYVYWESSQAPTKQTIKELDIKNTYYICRINKNRQGAKPDLLFKVNLNQNTWEELGQVCYREKVKGVLNG